MIHDMPEIDERAREESEAELYADRRRALLWCFGHNIPHEMLQTLSHACGIPLPAIGLEG
jgi:hypothetical protein